MICKIILIDFDHTLYDAAWRDFMIPEKDWDAYHAASDKDTIIPLMRDLVFGWHVANYEIVGLTGRNEKWRALTNTWLMRHALPIDNFYMRPDGNYTPAPQLKVALCDQHIPEWRERVAFIVDDRDDICAAFAAEGIPSFQFYHGGRR